MSTLYDISRTAKKVDYVRITDEKFNEEVDSNSEIASYYRSAHYVFDMIFLAQLRKWIMWG